MQMLFGYGCFLGTVIFSGYGAEIQIPDRIGRVVSINWIPAKLKKRDLNKLDSGLDNVA
jgi:hypothetical protein